MSGTINDSDFATNTPSFKKGRTGSSINDLFSCDKFCNKRHYSKFADKLT
jgi:hypothetical protein